MPEIGGFTPNTGGVYDTQGTGTEQVASEMNKTVEKFTSVLVSYIQNKSTGDKGTSGTSGADNAPKLDLPGLDIDPSDLAGLLLKMQSETSDTQLKTSKDSILADKLKTQQNHKEQLEKLMDSFEKMSKAHKSGVFGKIFGWIGAIASAIVGAVLIATGVGVAAGALMLAASAVMITQMALQESGVMEKLDPKLAMGLMIAMTALSIVLAIGSGGASLASSAASTATTVATTATKVAQVVKTAGAITTAATSIAGGSAGVATAVYNKQAADSQADVKELQAFLAKLQASMEDQQDKIKDLIEQLQSATSIVMDIMKSHNETKVQIFQNMAV